MVCGSRVLGKSVVIYEEPVGNGEMHVLTGWSICSKMCVAK